MADIEDLMLQRSRSILSGVERLQAGMREIKRKLGYLEESVISVSRRADRTDERVERVERRLELVN